MGSAASKALPNTRTSPFSTGFRRALPQKRPNVWVFLTDVPEGNAFHALRCHGTDQPLDEGSVRHPYLARARDSAAERSGCAVAGEGDACGCLTRARVAARGRVT